VALAEREKVFMSWMLLDEWANGPPYSGSST
jgi:hypothetical protein